MDGALAVTIVGMILNAATATIAAILVYRTARDKLAYDLEYDRLRQRVATLEAAAKIEPPRV